LPSPSPTARVGYLRGSRSSISLGRPSPTAPSRRMKKQVAPLPLPSTTKTSTKSAQRCRTCQMNSGAVQWAAPEASPITSPAKKNPASSAGFLEREMRFERTTLSLGSAEADYQLHKQKNPASSAGFLEREMRFEITTLSLGSAEADYQLHKQKNPASSAGFLEREMRFELTTLSLGSVVILNSCGLIWLKMIRFKRFRGHTDPTQTT
jgi:hypothetical protein